MLFKPSLAPGPYKSTTNMMKLLNQYAQLAILVMGVIWISFKIRLFFHARIIVPDYLELQLCF